jgi:hypothetical protein
VVGEPVELARLLGIDGSRSAHTQTARRCRRGLLPAVDIHAGSVPVHAFIFIGHQIKREGL